MKSVATKAAKQLDLHERLVSPRGLLGEVRVVSRHVTIPASSREIANARKT